MITRLVTIDSQTGITAQEKILEHDITLHVHDCYEIELVLDGKAIHTINGYSYEMSAGDIYLISPSDFHSIHTIKPLHVVNIIFTEQFVSPYLLYVLTSRSGATIGKLGKTEFENISSISLCMINSKNNIDDFKERFFQNLCECILIQLLNFLDCEFSSNNSNRSIYSAALFVKRNFKNKISLDNLAAVTGYSKNHFSKLFNATFKMGINEYITQARLSYAKKMLAATNEPITDICYDSGFNSFATFSREFKKAFGMSPSGYRKKYIH